MEEVVAVVLMLDGVSIIQAFTSPESSRYTLHKHF